MEMQTGGALLARKKGGESTKNPDVIEGWEAIANFAGYSIRTVKNFEKQGLQVHRSPRGKNTRVFAYASDIRDFVEAYLEAKSLDPEQLPPPLGNRAFPRFWRFAGIAVVLLFLATFMIWHSEKSATGGPDIPRDIGYYQWVENKPDHPHRLDLFDNRGERIRTLWQVPNGWDEQELRRLKIDSSHANIAIRKGRKGRQTILLESLGKDTFIHTVQKKTPLDMPDLGIQTLEPRWFDMSESVNGCFRIEGPTFSGWGLFVQGGSLFASCLLILDEEFQEKARLYHPGRLRYGISKGQSLVVGGTLNARPVDENLYRPALFKLSVPAILGCHCQIMPFSAKTIPDLDRRNNYQFKDLPQCPIEVYLALAPNHQYEFLLFETGQYLGFGSSLENEERMSLIFDWDLVFIEKWVVDHEYRGDFDLDYFKTRFQYWLGDFWGPWQAVFPP